MKPTTYELHIYQGASWKLEATFKDPNGAVIDLSGYSGELALRRSVQHSDVLLALDVAGGGVVLSDTEPNVVVRITAAETAALPTNNIEVEDWVYELRIFELGDPDYTTTRLLEGQVHVHPAVIR